MSVSQQASGFNYQIPPRYIIKTVTGSYSADQYYFTSADYGLIVVFNQKSSISAQLPPAASVGVGFNFWVWNIAAIGTYRINVYSLATETIDTVGLITIGGGQGVQFISDGSNWQTGSLTKPKMYSESYVATTTLASATGANSLAIGAASYAGSLNGVAIGTFASAGATSSAAIGYQCSTNSSNSVALGYSNTTNQTNSLGLGRSTTVNVIGKTQFGSPASLGTGHWGILPLYAATTSNVATSLTSDGAAAGNANQLIVPSNTAIAFSILVVARQKAANGTASAAWQVTGLIRQEATAATTTLVGTPTVTAISNVPAWTLAVTADTTNGALSVKGTGAASTNIQWLATVYSSEMTYA